jgi:hypothetical protein
MGPRILIRLGPYLVDGVDLHLESVAVLRVRWLLQCLFFFWLAFHLLLHLARLSAWDAGMISTEGWIFLLRRISRKVRGRLSLSFPGALVLVANHRFLSEGVRVVQLSHIIDRVLLSELEGLIRMSLGHLQALGVRVGLHGNLLISR